MPDSTKFNLIVVVFFRFLVLVAIRMLFLVGEISVDAAAIVKDEKNAADRGIFLFTPGKRRDKLKGVVSAKHADAGVNRGHTA